VNIYELEKKLAARSEGFPECNTHSDYSLARAQVVCRVGAHKCHHFMKALEALKNEVAIRFHDEDAKFYDKESLKILIKELEEVK